MLNAGLRVVALALVAFLPGCGQGGAPAPAAQAAGAPPTAGPVSRSAGGATPRPIPTDEQLSQVIAEVNGKPLYKAFYEQNLTFMRNRLPAGTEQDNLDRYLNAKFDALDRLVDDELICQEAQKTGLTASDQETLTEYTRIVNSVGGERDFLAGMRAQHISRSMAFEGVRKKVTIGRLVKEEIESQISISDSDLLEYYNAHLKRFTPEAWVKAYHILIKCPRSASAEDAEKSWQRAAKILANIRAGEPFERMARDYSEDGTANLGGNLGFIKRGAVYPEVEEVAFGLAPGQVSDVVRTDAGYHIVKITEKRGGEPRPYEEVKEKCREGLMITRKADALATLTARLRANSKIVSYLE